MDEKGSKILKAFVIVLLVAAFVATGFWFYQKYWQGRGGVQFSPDQVAGILLQKATTTIPENFETGESIEISKLPEQLRNLVLPGAVETEIMKVKYDNGEGYSVKYSLQETDMFAFNQDITSAALQNKWNITFGTRANQAGIIDLENETDRLRIMYSPILEGGILVTLKSVENTKK